MRFQNFEEWFAIIGDEAGDKIIAGRLSYSEKGIRLLTITSDADDTINLRGYLEGKNIVGLLDYQRPTTLINNFVKSSNFGSVGANTRYMRTSYEIAVNTIIKNIHLHDINDNVFVDLRINNNIFSAWLAWQLYIESDEPLNQTDQTTLNTSPSVDIKFELAHGIKVEIGAFPTQGWADREENLSLIPSSFLVIKFPSPLSFSKVEKIESNLEILFGFLVGVRLPSSPYYMTTTHTVTWNEEIRPIVAEHWFMPGWKRLDSTPYISSRMFTYNNTPIEIQKLIDACVIEDNADIFYYMNLALCFRMSDLKHDDYFIELVGCLENFEIRLSGIPHSRDPKSHLKKRLSRLIDTWKEDAFEGSPNVDEIVRLRNLKPHGRGHHISVNEIQNMYYINQFLAALLYYHLLKYLGFGRQSIAEGFRRMLQPYGIFIPKEFRP